ncbi:MAG: 5'-methylthioadenosine/adenosylhomocysteine nucleosidase [Paraprevotella sp.]|nr:5'-methylthioadenosine/adenosylhomocysteine nucleosidase [Paraprevotella sp.]
MKIGVMMAMQSEYDRLRSQMRTDGDTGSMDNGNELRLVQCGIGKVNAAVGAVELIRTWQPDCIISTGVAGGIDTVLNVTDVVVGSRTVYHDVWCGEGNAYGQVQGLPAEFAGDSMLCSHALGLEGTVPVHGGLICSGDRFITERSELNVIKEKFPDALAVDMESAAIAQVCHLYGVPFLSFRIISDTPGAEEHQAQYEDFWRTMAERSFAVTWQFLCSLPRSL